MDDLWELFWECWGAAYELGWIVVLFKVKSHTTDEDLARGIITWEHKIGNGFADTWAGYAAEINQGDENRKQLISWIDATAWIVQSRIMAVCQFLDSHKADERPKKPKKTIYTRLEELGHIPSPDDRKGWHRCCLCGTRWSMARAAHVKCRGKCPGPIWGQQYDLPDNDWTKLKQPGSRLIHNGYVLHPSHVFAWRQGIIYCTKCGSYSENRVVNLAKTCLLKPQNAVTESRLKNILQGLHPISGEPLAQIGDIAPPHIFPHLGGALYECAD